jgi:AcrR family transcriptional regulator
LAKDKDTKAVLLEKAAKLFLKHGYEKMTMRMLAKAAGIQAPAIYNYFKSKKEILRTIDNEGWRNFQEMVFDPIKSTKDPEERIRMYIRSMISYQFTMGERNPIIDSAIVAKASKDRKRQDREVFNFIRQTLKDLAETKGLKKSVNSTIAAFSLFSLVSQVYKWYKPRGEIGIEELSNDITTMFLSGFLGRDGRA